MGVYNNKTTINKPLMSPIKSASSKINLNLSLDFNKIKKKQVDYYSGDFIPQYIPLSRDKPRNTKMNRNRTLPRDISLFYENDFSENLKLPDCPPSLVNQYSLKDQTKFVLYKAKKRIVTKDDFGFEENGQEVEDDIDSNGNKIPPKIEWKQMKSSSSPLHHSGPKFEKIRRLLNVNLKSSVYDTKMDAIKHLGLLKASDNAVIYALNQILTDPDEKEEMIKFECVKTLILLGDFNENVSQLTGKYLNANSSNRNVKETIINTIVNAKNINYIDKTNQLNRQLIHNLEKLATSNIDSDANEEISLNACICIGKLGLYDNEIGIKRLMQTLESGDKDWHSKTIALEVLVKQFRLKNKQIIFYIVNQVDVSPLWMSRLAGARLLSHLGPNVIHKSEYFEVIWQLLEKKISCDPIREVRLAIGSTIKELHLFEMIFKRAAKYDFIYIKNINYVLIIELLNKRRNLESQDDLTRAQAVTAIVDII
jgi:hypothetical protein